ncbi:DUF6463 family protein [Longispora sp. K20-0274]|uniref:DUF6463 family protein n=1 Tax=Longispora sp. K20-0274 TaxID=3088255 RepID=UPI00399B3456
MRLTRWIPRLTNAIAVIHIVFGLVVRSPSPLTGIAEDGFVNAVAGDDVRMLWLWFEATGFALLALGELARWAVRETGRLPVRFGVWMLAIAVPLTVMVPASGGWLLIALGVAALFAARRAPRS